MKSKTLKQFLAEKRKAEVQTPEAVIQALRNLQPLNSDSYNASALIVNVTDLDGRVLTNAAINGEDFGAAVLYALIDAYRMTLASKAEFAKYRLNEMERIVKEFTPENSR